MSHAEKCPICNGKGQIETGNTSGWKQCHGCNGLGWITLYDYTSYPTYPVYPTNHPVWPWWPTITYNSNTGGTK